MSTDAAPLDVSADDTGLVIQGDRGGRFNVHLEGRRIWSIVPSRDGRKVGDGRYLVAWPPRLQARLDGIAHLELHDLDTGATIDGGEVSFGSGTSRLQLVNQEGQPLVVDKGGLLGLSFDTSAEQHKARLLDAVEQTLEVLHRLDVQAFLAFGCLLGAVREGALIAHDNDADLAYVASSSHPFDVIRESLALERSFLDLGWATERASGGGFKVLPPDQGEHRVAIDIFTGLRRGDDLYLMPSVRASLPDTALFPLSTVTLEGRSIAAPADPEALLEATYGPGWRVPDPTFKFTPSRSTKLRLSGWMRGERKNQRYWGDFYRTRADAVPTDPSSFARWVAGRESPPARILDIGSGTGRDSHFFAAEGFDVLGCDYSPAGVRYATRKARRRGLHNVDFEELNLYDLRHVLARGARISRSFAPDVLYARFLVHAVDDEGRRNLLLLSRSVLRSRAGRLYLEFRTERTEHEFGEHFRQFVQADQVVDELEGYGFEIDHCEDRYGLAVHKNEDPKVARIVARVTR